MQLSEALKNYLAEELRIVSEKIDQAPNPIDQAFFFSAAWAAVQRVLNIEYDPRLVLIHLVCLTTHSAIASRLQALKEDREASIKVDSVAVSHALSALMRELSARIKNDEDVWDVLERLSVISYSATGNGAYLASIGRLR
ncbi:MAG TPA: hypothetical protein VJM69_03105 [Dehalococcoidia bacterium]|nr:hypothetical protein [Dehalococcoidia bacterium]